MPVRWTPELDRRLLLLALELVKVDNKKIAELWASKHGNDGGEQPTARAITERLVSLKKMASGGGGGTGKANGTPSKPAASLKATPKKLTVPKTPSSSNKRPRKTMSDEDDSEGELNGTPTAGKRTEYNTRRSKTPKVYQDPGSEQEAADDEAEANGGKFVGGLGHGYGSIFDQDLNLDGASERKSSGFASRRKMIDEDAMSDVSDFKPENGFY